MRSRGINADFFKDEKISELSRDGRLLFIGLWCYADREGRFKWSEKRIRVEIFPYDLDIDIDHELNLIEKLKFIRRYEVDGKAYGEIINFKKYQRPHRTEKASSIPKNTLTVDLPLINGEPTVREQIYLHDEAEAELFMTSQSYPQSYQQGVKKASIEENLIKSMGCYLTVDLPLFNGKYLPVNCLLLTVYCYYKNYGQNLFFEENDQDDQIQQLEFEPEKIQSKKQKAILTKSQSEGFDKFWDAYPVKKAKGEAEKAWKAINPSDGLIFDMLIAIKAQAEEKECLRRASRFAPNWKNPATWLRAKAWLDEPLTIDSGASGEECEGIKDGFDDIDESIRRRNERQGIQSRHEINQI